jgi:hypothetical protein
MKGKHSGKFKVGITLIIYTTVMLGTIPLWTNRWGYVDFPCYWYGDTLHLTKPNASTRIAYCISLYPRNAYGAGPLLGSSTEDKGVMIGASGLLKLRGLINLQRQGDILLVNGRVLQVGETYVQHIYSYTLNPWLLAATDLGVKNDGVRTTTSNGSENIDANILFVSGDAKEKWVHTPMGLALFGIGIGLLTIDILQRRRNPKIA